MSNIKDRIIEAMNEWEEGRLKEELEIFINKADEEELSELFFDDIATEEEHENGKLK